MYHPEAIITSENRLTGKPYARYVKCVDGWCLGNVIYYNVTKPEVMCRLITLPYLFFFVLVWFFYTCILDLPISRTHDLTLCEQYVKEAFYQFLNLKHLFMLK